MQVDEYQSLFNHMEWADAHVWRSVLSLRSLEHDGPMRERLHHFHSTPWAYGQVLRGRPLDIPELNSFFDLRSIGLWARRLYREVPDFMEGLTEERLIQIVEFPWAAQVAKRLGSAGPATVGNSVIRASRPGLALLGKISTVDRLPAHHIGRSAGGARAHPVPRSQSAASLNPDLPWSRDADKLGTNDFRSTKGNVISASLLSPGGSGLRLSGGGTHAVRAFMDGSRVGPLVAGFNTGGGESFFAPHYAKERRPVKRGDPLADRFAVSLFP
jgi:hypothetical protein